MSTDAKIKAKTLSIGEVGRMFGLSVPTLRYYDQEHLIPHLRKSAAGVRRFTQDNVNAVRMIQCLKSAGMPIKDIQLFMTKVQQGDKTLASRLAMFERLKERVKSQIQDLQNTLAIINFKCDYYHRAVQDGTEKYVCHEMNLSDLVLNNKNSR